MTDKKFSIEKIISDLQDLIKIQKDEAHRDDYSRGLANGLILALSVITSCGPKYIAKKPATNIWSG